MVAVLRCIPPLQFISYAAVVSAPSLPKTEPWIESTFLATFVFTELRRTFREFSNFLPLLKLEKLLSIINSETLDGIQKGRKRETNSRTTRCCALSSRTSKILFNSSSSVPFSHFPPLFLFFPLSSSYSAQTRSSFLTDIPSPPYFY